MALPLMPPMSFHEIQGISRLISRFFFIQPKAPSMQKLLALKILAEAALQEMDAAVRFNNLVENMPYSLIGLSMVFCDQRAGSHLTIRCIYEHGLAFLCLWGIRWSLTAKRAVAIQILHHRKLWTLAL